MATTRSTAYAYTVVITTEEEHKVFIEFESPNQLSEDEQKEKAEQILSAVKDDLESGVADIEMQPTKTMQRITETTTYRTKS